MADDKKNGDGEKLEESSDASVSAGNIEGPERPTPTIELEAEEVKDEERSGESDGDDETKDSDKASGTDQDADRDDSAAKDPSESESDSSATVWGSPASNGSSDEPPEKVVATYTEPPRTRMSQVSGFFTHLAAGLVGGLIAVIAMGTGVERWLLGELGGVSPPAQTAAPEAAAPAFDPSGLESQIKALDERVAALGKAEQPSGPSPETQKSIAALEERTAKLEQDASQKSETEPADAERLNRLEAALKNLSDTAKENGNTVAPVAGVLAQINEFASGFDTKLAGLQEQVKQLESQAGEGGDSNLSGEVDALKSQAQTLAGEVTQLRQRVDDDGAKETAEALGGVEQRIATLETDVKRLAEGQAQEKGEGRSAALAIAFANLQSTVDSGAAYRNQLDTLKALAPSGTDLSALQSRAASGIPTRAQLTASFADYANATYEAVSAPASEEDWIGRIAAGARSLVRVRRSGEPEGNTPGAVVARMQAAVKEGELAKAAEQGDALEGKPREAMQPWIEGVSKRLAAERELDVLERKLLGAIGGAQGAGSG